MNVSRSISTASSSAWVCIYGLDENKRNRLAKDRNDFQKCIRMSIFAGYDGNISCVYRGMVNECFSFRQGGDTEFKTVIDSADAVIDMLYGNTSIAFQQGTDPLTMINSVSSKLIGLQMGVSSPFVTFTTPKRGFNVTDKPINILRNFGIVTNEFGETESTMSIDLGVVNYLRQEYDVLKELGILIINDDYGLLSTPRRKNTLLTIRMLFEPAAMLNQLCILDSKLLGITGRFKIMSVSHNGTISGGRCGSMITDIDLFMGQTTFNEV
ncbi:MAG: hypothetical protein UE295_00485 [Acutalibacteraceae bacterium]|nr:hypothetical protein [Acutalibacteraceae bacterium]